MVIEPLTPAAITAQRLRYYAELIEQGRLTVAQFEDNISYGFQPRPAYMPPTPPQYNTQYAPHFGRVGQPAKQLYSAPFHPHPQALYTQLVLTLTGPGPEMHGGKTLDLNPPLLLAGRIVLLAPEVEWDAATQQKLRQFINLLGGITVEAAPYNTVLFDGFSAEGNFKSVALEGTVGVLLMGLGDLRIQLGEANYNMVWDFIERNLE